MKFRKENEKMKDKLTFDKNKAKEFFLEEISFLVGPYELKDLIANKIDEINIVDVRKYDDYIEGHIPYAIHVPYDSLEEHLVMFEKDKVNIVYCYNNFCKLGHKAAYKIAKEGYPVQVLHGGYRTWKKFDFDTVKTSADEG